MRVLRNGGLALLVFLGVAENVYRPDKAARVAAGRPIADRALPIHAKTLRDLREPPVDQSRFRSEITEFKSFQRRNQDEAKRKGRDRREGSRSKGRHSGKSRRKTVRRYYFAQPIRAHS